MNNNDNSKYEISDKNLNGGEKNGGEPGVDGRGCALL